MTDLLLIRAGLEEKLSELLERHAHLDRELVQPLDPDHDDRAVEMEDDASLQAQNQLVVQEINAIEDALQRIALGTYGTCVKCGNAIAAQRLEALPEAALCRTCASDVP